MLRGHPGVRRWEETDDVLQNAMLRLDRALKDVALESSLHFWNLAALQINRELLDLADHYQGPHGHGANHHTDWGGKAADDAGRPLHDLPDQAGEPSSLSEWSEFHQTVERLPEVEREVFGLLFYDGLSQGEAAALLGVSVRSFKRRWQETRHALAKALKGERPH
jgi:RNA polymerase sigma factor (sigma-70 family)